MRERHRLFVEEYLVDLHATNAAIRAGYKPSRARRRGHELLQMPEVAAAVQQAMNERSERTQITQDMVMQELSRIAFGDNRRLMQWGPNGVELKPSSEIGDDAAASVAEVSESQTNAGRNLRLKSHDKVKALELIGRHLGMFNDKLAVTGADGGPQQHVVRWEK